MLRQLTKGGAAKLLNAFSQGYVVDYVRDEEDRVQREDVVCERKK